MPLKNQIDLPQKHYSPIGETDVSEKSGPLISRATLHDPSAALSLAALLKS
jgi:hypothetical protein